MHATIDLFSLTQSKTHYVVILPSYVGDCDIRNEEQRHPFSSVEEAIDFVYCARLAGHGDARIEVVDFDA